MTLMTGPVTLNLLSLWPVFGLYQLICSLISLMLMCSNFTHLAIHLTLRGSMHLRKTGPMRLLGVVHPWAWLFQPCARLQPPLCKPFWLYLPGVPPLSGRSSFRTEFMPLTYACRFPHSVLALYEAVFVLTFWCKVILPSRSSLCTWDRQVGVIPVYQALWDVRMFLIYGSEIIEKCMK